MCSKRMSKISWLVWWTNLSMLNYDNSLACHSWWSTCIFTCLHSLFHIHHISINKIKNNAIYIREYGYVGTCQLSHLSPQESHHFLYSIHLSSHRHLPVFSYLLNSQKSVWLRYSIPTTATSLASTRVYSSTIWWWLSKCRASINTQSVSILHSTSIITVFY